MFGPRDCLAWLDAAVAAHGGVNLFAGSAISIWKPSNLPSAPGLSHAVARSLVDSTHSLDDLKPQLVPLLAERPVARLEAIFDEFERHVPNVSHDLLSVLSTGTPNWFHDWIADLFISRTFRTIYTTNQDLLIERALADRGWSLGIEYAIDIPERIEARPLPRIVKLHGSIDQPASVRTSFTRVGQRLPTALVQSLGADLEALPMLVIGYSGNDVDLRPTFLQATARDVLWLEHPRALSPEHFACILRERGKHVHALGCDLSEFPTATGGQPLALGVSEGNEAALRVAARTLPPVPEAAKALLVARMLRWTRASPESRALRGTAQRRARRLPDRSTWQACWLIDFDIGEYHLYYARFVVGNVLAYLYYDRARRQARRLGDALGQANAYRGMGMAVDMIGYAMLPWAYRWTARRIYRPAIRLLRKAPLGLHRQLMHHHLALLLGRALARVGPRPAAERRLLRLAQRGVLPFVRGHALRHLAQLYAEDARFSEAEALLDAAEQEFEYLEARTELADVQRNRSAVAVAAGDPRATSYAQSALAHYQSIGVPRGVVKARALLLFSRSRYLGTLARRYAWARRLVLAL